MKKQRPHFTVSERDIAWLRTEAERRCCSMSQVVRDLIMAERERRAAK